MISEIKPAGCYVYITLTGQTQAITAGRLEIAPDRTGDPVGRFIYGRHYLEREDAVEIDPVELKLGRNAYETKAMQGIFGALRDAGPDIWGRRIIERHAGVTHPGELDYLLQSPDDRAGALGFGLGPHPPAPLREFNKTLDLPKLQAIADAIEAEEDHTTVPQDAGQQVKDLLLIGTSMGGARPKAVVEHKDGLWLAKFNCRTDKWNNARVEHAMLRLARSCGIASAESEVTTVAGRDVLLVKRFDREKTAEGYLRTRMISALTLLRAEDSHRSRDKWSYPALAEELRRVCAQPRKNAVELFRRMCFNALISNADDHLRNHALIASDREWKLSPAYDLTPTSPISLERRDLALTCGNYGRYANAGNLLSESARFLLEANEAAAIVLEMQKRVGNSWHEAARTAGVSEEDCKRIAGAFSYPGFGLQLDSQ